MKRTPRYLTAALVVVLVLGFMYAVYPTRYFYLSTTTTLSPQHGSQQYPVRIDRLTGKTEILFGIGGWLPAVR